MLIGSITRSRSKKLQQTFNLLVQEWLNEELSLEAYKDSRKGRKRLGGPRKEQPMHVKVVIHMCRQENDKEKNLAHTGFFILWGFPPHPTSLLLDFLKILSLIRTWHTTKEKESKNVSDLSPSWIRKCIIIHIKAKICKTPKTEFFLSKKDTWRKR